MSATTPPARSEIVRLAEGGITFERGDPSGADLVVTGPPSAVAAAVHGGRTFDAMEGAGALHVEGDRALARRLEGLFPLPPKAEPPSRGLPAGTSARIPER